MTSYDTKVFWKYVFYEQLHPKNWAKSSTFWEYVLMFILLYSVFFSGFNIQRKAYITFAFLIAITFLKFYALYKSGYHRHWNRVRYGMPTKSDIKRIKTENFQSRNQDSFI